MVLTAVRATALTPVRVSVHFCSVQIQIMVQEHFTQKVTEKHEFPLQTENFFLLCMKVKCR